MSVPNWKGVEPDDPLLRGLWSGALSIAPKLSEWRRYFHMNPSVSGSEGPTARKILDILTNMGIDAEIVPGQSAVVGRIFGKGGGKAAGLRADIDALPIQEAAGRGYGSTVPGVMHACGHDAHTAIQLGAAELLMGRRDTFNGEARLLFEPAEETEGGAQPLVDAGKLDGVSAVFALHMQPSLKIGQLQTRPGAMSGSSSEVILEIIGQSAHGAYPERGIDAIVLAAQTVMAMQTLISRRVSALDSVALSFGVINGGTAPNILARSARLHGTLRALSVETHSRLLVELEKLVKGVCVANGGDCEVTINQGYHSVECSPEFVSRLNALAGTIGVEALLKPTPSLGVDSFGDFTAVAPGLYYDLGCVTEDDAPQIHTAEFDIDERCLSIGAFLQAGLALGHIA
ncbi:MAG: amidohydrolase [Oscillospiraceae bacterium]|nr:amidohydrolase [Oscillospiraceae bacterium]